MLSPRRLIFVVLLFQLFRQLFFGRQKYRRLLFKQLQGRIRLFAIRYAVFNVVLVLVQLHASFHAILHPLFAQNPHVPHPRVSVFRARRFLSRARLFRNQMRHHVLLQIRAKHASILLHHLLNTIPLLPLKPSHADHAVRKKFERKFLVLVRQLAALGARVHPHSRHDWNVP